jgi:hypothetical protein
MPTPVLGTSVVGFGHFLPGGQLLPAGIKGINETYRGWIEVDNLRHQAFVKFLRPWELFNELLGSVLCQLVALPTPKVFLVVVNRDEYPSPALFPDDQIQHALAFASQAMPADALSRRMSLTSLAALRTIVEEWTEWPDVLIFDQWIANPDRHTGNVLMGQPGEFYLIDHGLCFYRQNWTPEELLASVSLVTTRLWTDFLQAVVSPQQRLDATSRIHAASETQNGVDLHSALLGTKVQEFIPEPNRLALVQFLTQRRTAGPQVVCSAIGVPILPFGDAK